MKTDKKNSALEEFNRIAGQEKFTGWRRSSEFEKVFDIPYFGSVLRYTLETNNGTDVYYSILREFGWSEVFGVTKDKKVITIVQWKPGVNKGSWELPPGGIGMMNSGASDEELLAKTKKIFLRETGYGNGNWDYLGNTIIESAKYIGAQITDHGFPAHMFLATDLEHIQEARSHRPEEIIETLLVPLDEWKEIMASKKFKESSAHSCAYEALIKLGKLKWA